jgi:hypothetical protein
MSITKIARIAQCANFRGFRRGLSASSGTLSTSSMRVWGGSSSGSSAPLTGAYKPMGGVAVRGFAISDTIIGMAERGMSGNKEKQFREMMELMTTVPKWSLKSWKVSMDSQLNSWMMYVPGVSSSDEVKEIKEFTNILDAMSDHELENPDTIDGPAREKIAAKAGKPVDDITRMLFFYKQSLIICNWLQMKKKAGEALPENEQELQSMQSSDGRLGSIAKKVMSPRGKKTGRGRRLPF